MEQGKESQDKKIVIQKSSESNEYVRFGKLKKEVLIFNQVLLN